MWAIVLLLVNVIWKIVDTRYINILDKGFESLGCWRDAWSRSLPTLEGEHYLLMDPNYKGRRHALFKCARAALDKGYKLFGIENGGQCFASAEGKNGYHKYGVSKECKGDGKGGPWSLQVYRFSDQRDVINGAYNQWSSWGSCSKTCAGGVRRRIRKCSSPHPSNGGRDCKSLGPNAESQDCNVKSCTIKFGVGIPESRDLPIVSTKRDENQLRPPAGVSHSISLLQTNSAVNDGTHQQGHSTNNQDIGISVDLKQQPSFNNNGDQSSKEEGKSTPMSHTNNQDMGLVGGQKQQPSFNNNGHQSKNQEGMYVPMSREEVNAFKQVAVFQNSKPASNLVEGSENVKEKEGTHGNALNLAPQRNSKQSNDKTDMQSSSSILPKPNVLQDNQIKPVVGSAQLSNANGASMNGKLDRNNGAMVQEFSQPNNRIREGQIISIPSDKSHNVNSNKMATTTKSSNDENDMHSSSSAHPKPNVLQDNQIKPGAGSTNAKEASISGNTFNGKLDKNIEAVAQDFSQPNSTIREGKMISIPSDKSHNVNSNKMATAEGRQNQNGVTLGFPDKMPTDVESHEQHYSDLENGSGHAAQSTEMRITPNGKNTHKQFHNSQKTGNPQNVADPGDKPEKTPKQNFQNVVHGSGHTPVKGEEGSSDLSQSDKNNKTVVGVQQSSLGQQPLKPAAGTQPNGKKYNKADSDNSQESQQKVFDKEKQDGGQKTGKTSSTSSQFQGSTPQHGGKVDDAKHFPNKGDALSINKEKAAGNQSPQQVQTNPNEGENVGSKLEEKPKKVSDASKIPPSDEKTSSHQSPEGDKNGNQELDQGHLPQEVGEPVPIVDLNKAGTQNGEDYGPATNDVFSGPAEDTGVQNQPQPESNEMRQPSGPEYDNEAIQGISDMSQRADQNIFQQGNSASQSGPDESMGIGYDDMGTMSQAYTSENSSEKPKDEREDETTIQGRYQDQNQNQAHLTSDYYNTEPADDCLCPKKECSAKADIAFLVDGSANIPQPYYARVLEFIKIFSRGFDKSNIHVGIMAYGDDVKTALDLRSLTDFKQFDDAISVAPYMGGKAHTGNALSKMKTGLFAISGRQDAPRALILLSSGGSVDDVVAPGEELRDSGVKVTAIGLGKQANVRELITVASEPKSEHVFTAFLDTLPNAMDEIIQGVCRDVMGIVRDRQEPCTCESYNGHVGPSLDYNKASPEKETEAIGQKEKQTQGSLYLYPQGQKDSEGTRMPVNQNENQSLQFHVNYESANKSGGSRIVEEGSNSNKPEDDGDLGKNQRGTQPNDNAPKIPSVFQRFDEEYAKEHGDAAITSNEREEGHGQVSGGQEERPLSDQSQQSPLRDERFKAVVEKENRQNGADDDSISPKFKNDGDVGQGERLATNSPDRAQDHTNSPATHRFAAGLPEHYKPHVSDGSEKSSNQDNYNQEGNKQSSEARFSYQETNAHQSESFPSPLVLNQERVQGSGLHVHPAFIPPPSENIHGKPFVPPRYPHGFSRQDELPSEYKRPTKVMAVGKAPEYVNSGAQQQHQQECNGLNLGVVLDSTATPSGQDKKQATQMMDLAKKVSHLFAASPEGNSVGMVVYGGSPQPSVVHFDRFLDQKSMDEAIDNASNPSVEIRIGKALTLAQKQLFSQLSRSKRNVLLLVTDGVSFDDVSRPAVELKRRGIEVFCLGVGHDVNKEQLDLIASEPKENHVFLAPLNDADTLMERIQKEICLAANRATRLPTQRKCPSDLGFVIDGSRSVEVLGKGNFKKMLEFVKNVSLGFHIAPDDTRVGAITYGTEPQLAIPFNKYASPDSLAFAIENILYPGTFTMTGKALDLASQKLFDKESRINVPKVLVVLSKGASRDSVEQSAQTLHRAGVTVISVALGPSYDNTELNNIASLPVAYHVLKTKFNELQHKVNKLQDMICEAKTAQKG